jgi:hypothetical protein
LFHVEQKYFQHLTIFYKIFRYFVTVSLLNKIFITALATSYLAVASVCVHAQNKIIPAKPKHHRTYLSFRTGAETRYPAAAGTHSRQSKLSYSYNNSVIIKKSIGAHLKIESGVNYNTLPNNPVKLEDPNSKAFNMGKIGRSVSLPASVQYCFLPEKNKFNVFCGAGMQINLYGNSNSISLLNNNARPESTNQPSGTKYISVLFTQGITFEINTKIQLTQSFHFIPENSEKSIGIDVGIGFKID